MSLLTRLKGLNAYIVGLSLVLATLTFSAQVNAEEFNCGYNCCPTNCGPVCCDVVSAPCLDWGYNPPAHEKCACASNGCGSFCDNLTGRADFLWWRPFSEGTELGYSAVNVETYATIYNDFSSTSYRDVNFKFDPGFRLGLNYYCPSSCIDISLVWTHFHSKANAEGVGNVNNEAFVNFWEFNSDFLPDVAKERWTLDMDLLDLEFAQYYYINHCFSLRPHIDLRFARIDQNVHVESYSQTATMDILSFNAATKAKNDFRGIGPRLGLDLEINLGCNLFLYGKAGGALVYGQFDRHGEELATAYVPEPPAGVVDGTFISRGKNVRSTVTMTDFTIGLKWEHCFECCNVSHPFALAIAWEQNTFYNLNDFNFLSDRSKAPKSHVVVPFTVSGNNFSKKGNLYTQGLTVTATLGF